jgi:hypothetical protein
MLSYTDTTKITRHKDAVTKELAKAVRKALPSKKARDRAIEVAARAGR